MALPEHLIGDRAVLEETCRQRCQVVRLHDAAILCRVLGKYLVFADPEDLTVTPHLCLNGYWESWTTLAVARSLAPGNYCLDVGANHGYFTVLMADAVGDTGRVLAFEPNPRLARLLQQTLDVNGFLRHAAVDATAVCDADGTSASLLIPRHRSADGTLARQPHAADVVETVATVTLDSATRGWPRVDFVKIDAEGSEESIWRGMAQTVRNNPAITIVIEFKPDCFRDPQAFLASVRAAGFPLRHIDTDGEVRELCDRHPLGNGLGGEWMLFLRRNE